MCEISFRDFEVCLLTSFGFGGTGGGDVGGVVKGELVFRIGGGKVEGRTGGCATEWIPGSWSKGVVASEIFIDSSKGSWRDKVDETPLLDAGIDRIDSADIDSLWFNVFTEAGPKLSECRL